MKPIGHRSEGRDQPAAFDERRELALARLGDSQAFERLVRRYADAVYGFLVRWLRDPDLARDVFQEATLRCYRSLGRIDPEVGFRPWFFRIAVNRAKSAAERRSVRDRVEVSAGVEALAPSGEARYEATVLVERALELLSANDRRVLLLRFVEGMSMREIGLVLRIPEVVAKMRLSRARRRFRDCYARMVQE